MIAKYYLAFMHLPLIVFLSAHPAKADTSCGSMALEPRLDMTRESGCVVSQFINRQIENPRDLRKARSESANDTTRRIKILSDWRSAKPTSPTTSTSPQTQTSPQTPEAAK